MAVTGLGRGKDEAALSGITTVGKAGADGVTLRDVRDLPEEEQGWGGKAREAAWLRVLSFSKAKSMPEINVRVT